MLHSIEECVLEQSEESQQMSYSQMGFDGNRWVDAGSSAHIATFTMIPSLLTLLATMAIFR